MVPPDQCLSKSACQALGIDPQAAGDRAKYESSGGPSYRRIASLLVAHARDEEAELTALTRAMTFTLIIGNADAHGKNLSLLHDGVGHISLAPLYDTVPTELWPNLRATSAMSVNGIVAFERITLGDLAREASSWGLDYERALTAAGELAAEVRDLVPAVIDHHEFATRVLSQVNRLLQD